MPRRTTCPWHRLPVAAATSPATTTDSSYAESGYTFANAINTREGGTHEEGFRAALASSQGPAAPNSVGHRCSRTDAVDPVEKLAAGPWV